MVQRPVGEAQRLVQHTAAARRVVVRLQGVDGLNAELHVAPRVEFGLVAVGQPAEQGGVVGLEPDRIPVG